MIGTADTSFAAMTSGRVGMPAPATTETSRRRGHRRRLHPAHHWEIALRYVTTEKVEAIAAQFGVSTSTVSTIARRLGVPPRRGARKGTLSLDEIRTRARQRARTLRDRAAELLGRAEAIEMVADLE